MMLGTAGELPQAPKEKVVFMEDMSESQLAATVRIFPKICDVNFITQPFKLPSTQYKYD